MTDTLEAVARAIWELWPHQTVGAQRRRWLEVGPNDREAIWFPLARAAILETLRGMMEPSEAMDLAGDNSFQWGGPTGNEWLEAADSTACWQAMLTQKIKEVEGE